MEHRVGDLEIEVMVIVEDFKHQLPQKIYVLIVTHLRIFLLHFSNSCSKSWDPLKKYGNTGCPLFCGLFYAKHNSMDTQYSTCLVGVPLLGVPEAGLEPGEGAAQAPFSLPTTT